MNESFEGQGTAASISIPARHSFGTCTSCELPLSSTLNVLANASVFLCTSTIEEIIERKDENLKALLEAKERVGMDPRSISEADTLVDQVLDLQEKNVESFRRLFQKQFKLSQGKVDSENPIDRKLRKAYFAFGEDRLPDTES